MAVIQPYEEQASAQGSLNLQVTPDQFGANVGTAIHGFGEAVRGYEQAVYRNEAESDVTNAHVQMAKKRAEWQQKLTDLGNATQPGDETFVPRVMDGIRSDLDTLGEQFKTKAGQQTFARMSADMTAMFGQEAIGIQSRLNGEFAKNQYRDLSSSLGTVAAQDHTQVESLRKQAREAIDDPNGRFAKVPEATREAFRRDIDEQIKFDAAKGFARRYPNAVLGQVPETIRDTVRNVVANPPTPGLPPNLGGKDVKPYDQAVVSSLARRVDQPSQYDKAFQAAANQYNLDWRELKMRSVAESGLNPAAVSNKNAGGIMQLTPETAAQLGVNRDDPVASIFGAAKLISQYKSKAGGDMATVDKMYYGGESGKAWGPNTQQYAANLAALRQSVGLGSQVPPEAFAPNAATQVAASQDFKKPTTGISFIDSLPADKFFSVLTEAEHYQRAYDTQSERARMEKERLEKQQRDAVMNGYLDRIVQPGGQNGGALSEAEIMRNPVLTFQEKQHLIDYRFTRERELRAQSEPRSNPAEVRNLMLQIHAADDDPTKTYNTDPVMESYRLGRISTPEMMTLRKEVEQLRDGNSNPFQKDVQSARNAVYTALTRSIIGQAQPEVAADAAYRFNADMEQQIARLRKENKDPRVLLDPTSRDYLLKPERIQSFMKGSSAALGDGAAKVAKAEAKALPTYKDFDTLPKGSQFTDPQGNVRVKP